MFELFDIEVQHILCSVRKGGYNSSLKTFAQLLYSVGVRDTMSLQEVGMLLGVSKERVGQIRDSALRQLESVKC